MEFYNELQSEILKSLLDKGNSLYSLEHIISWFTNLKMHTFLEVTYCDLKDIRSWTLDNTKISHNDQKYFEVLGVRCKIGNREISQWDQPIIRQREEGIIGFIIKRINGVYHLLVQAKLEPGNFDILEMAPTVQCITGSYKNPEYDVEYLEFFTGNSYKILYNVIQSEEGGRFYHEQNKNMLVEVGEDFPIVKHPRFIWMTFSQAKEFIKFNNYFNIEARSLLACITPV